MRELPKWLSPRTRWAITQPEMTAEQFFEARVFLKMTQHYLARLLAVSEQSVRRWEHGKSRIPRPAQTLVRAMVWDELPEKPA